MKLYSASATSLLALTAALAASGAAWAQTPGAQPSAPVAATQIDDIVVTANKRSQSVQEIAAAVSALSGETLEQRGINDAAGLQFAVPSLDVGTLRVGGTYITIRGVGLNQGSPGVAVHVDGVYQSESSMADLAQADLERVEVLRGPQGTLYGRNANGGVINFISKKPTDTFEGEVMASYAEYEQSHLLGKLNIPITDTVRSRFVVDYAARDQGFVKNIAGGEDLDAFERLSGRALVDVDFTPDVNLLLSASASRDTGPASYFQLRTLPNAAALANQPLLATANISLKPFTTTANDPSTSERELYQVSATLSAALGFADLKSITAYTDFSDDVQTDSDGSNLSLFLQTNSNKIETFTQELTLSATGSTLDWVLGAFYLRERAERTLFFSFPQGSGALPPNGYLNNFAPVRDSDVYAVFGDATLHVTDRLNVIAGARYSEEKQDYAYSSGIGLFLGGTRVPLFNLCAPRTDSPSFSSFTPRGGLQYTLTDDSNLYATVSRGFKAGGANLNSCGNIFQPEEITATEIGYRSTWFDRSLTFNVTGFNYDYTDLQLSQVTGLVNLVTNAAGAEVWGVELESSWSPNDNFLLGGNLSWLDAKYTSFTNVDTLNPALGAQVLDGNRLSNAPEWSANLSASLSSDPGPNGRFTARADVSYKSKVYFREFNTALDEQGAFTVVNTSLIWEAPSEAYQVRVFANNLFDEVYIAQGGSSDALGTLAITYGAPRQVGAEVRYRF
jgi:iron complex outermembrane receptor protein